MTEMTLGQVQEELLAAAEEYNKEGTPSGKYRASWAAAYEIERLRQALTASSEQVRGLIAERDELRRRIELSACGTVVACGDDEDGQPRVLIHSTRLELMRGPAIVGKRVALVVLEASYAS